LFLNTALDPAVLRVVRFTVVQAVLSAALSLALGLPGALLLSRLRGRSAFVLRSVCALPFALPPILAVLGFVLFFGNSGWLNRALQAALSVIATGSAADADAPLQILYRPAAIVLAHGFYNFPIAVRLAGDGIARARRAYAPAAASLGASPLGFTLTVLLPLISPALAASFLLAFLYSFTSFAVVLVLGGGPAASTLAVEIYRSARVALDYERAGSLCLAETLIAALAFGLYLLADRKGRVSVPDDTPPLDVYGARHGAGGGAVLRRAAALAYAVPMGVFVLGPLLSVVAEGFLARPSRAALPVPTLRWWAALGERALPALWRSALVAALAATLACVLSVLAAGALKSLKPRSAAASMLRFLCSSPLASSGVVLSLGFALLYGRVFSRTVPALVIVHAVIALPFSFSSVLRGFEGIPSALDAAAASLGASPPVRLLTVDIPLALPHIRSAWGFAAAISMGELNAVLMLGMEGWETLPLLVYRAAGAYRYGADCSEGAILLAD
jgi:thiamine transport system permease protein